MVKLAVTSFLVLGVSFSSCSAMGVLNYLWGETDPLSQNQKRFTETLNYLHQNEEDLKLQKFFTAEKTDEQQPSKKLVKSEQNSFLNYVLPSFVFEVENPSEIINLDLFAKVGDRVYQFNVSSFKLAYEHVIFKEMCCHPMAFMAGAAGLYTLSCLPGFMTIPLVTSALLGGGGYFALKNVLPSSARHQVAPKQSIFTWKRATEIFYQQIGFGTTVAQLLEKNKEVIQSSITLDGRILTFEGVCYDGFWGLQKHLKVELAPVSYISASFLQD